MTATARLGAGVIFHDADLTGIAEGMGHVFVGQDVHATHVDVDEVGTRAVATSAIEEATANLQKRSIFLVDRPFIYAIVHGPENEIVFLGVCMDPRGTN